MKAYIAKINGVRGFVGATYAIFKDQKCLKIFLTKKEAIDYCEKCGFEFNAKN